MSSKNPNLSGPWGISIRSPKQSIMRVMPQEEGESLKESLDRVKTIVRALRDKYLREGKDVVVEIISRRKAFKKPDNVVIKPGYLWCPYCSKPRHFKRGQTIFVDTFEYESDYRRCVICGMSDHDYYVRHENHLWKKEG